MAAYRYWDSNAFLGWLTPEADKVEICRSVLDGARAGDLVIITSALTIAEVLWLKGQAKLPAHRAKEIEAFFRHKWIVVRDVDRFIAEDARALVWDHAVKPKDAIHLATALRGDVFPTYQRSFRSRPMKSTKTGPTKTSAAPKIRLPAVRSSESVAQRSVLITQKFPPVARRAGVSANRQ